MGSRASAVGCVAQRLTDVLRFAFMEQDPSSPPPRKIDAMRMEALRAAASVHRGQGTDARLVLIEADAFDEWLSKR